MSFLKRRDAHLDELLNMEIRNPELLEEDTSKGVVVPRQQTSVVASDPTKEMSLDDSLMESQQALERMFATAEEVLVTSADLSNNSGKSRDVESFSALLGQMTSLQAQIIEAKEKRLKDKEKAVPQTAIQNNTIIVKSVRELNSILKGNYDNSK